MIKTERVIKTAEYLRTELYACDYFKGRPEEIDYRYEHSIRVANIGSEIAKREGIDEEMLVIACLLHDIAYSRTFPEGHDWRNHGRDGAKIAREFLPTIGFDEAQINEICYGIAIHVDDVADFEGERTPLALSVSDADNIDRFDAYRIYDNLNYAGFDKLSLAEKTERCRTVLQKLEQFRQLPFGTEAGKQMWLEKLNFQTEFFTRLYNQMQNSVFSED